MTGSVYVIATPLGNLADLSTRAIETLHRCQLIAAEDTRHSGRLLAQHGVKTPLVALHEHSNTQVMRRILQSLAAENNVGLITDAGTPLISDPGFELVRAARLQGIRVLPIPGPSAAIAALSVSGLPTDCFAFHGFPPARQKARIAWLHSLATQRATLIFYESCHRIVASVADMAIAFGANRAAFIAREMTKLHEQYELSDLATIHDHLLDATIPKRGEFVLLIGAYDGPPATDVEQEARRWIKLLLAELSASNVARVAATATGLTRQYCYAITQDLKNTP